MKDADLVKYKTGVNLKYKYRPGLTRMANELLAYKDDEVSKNALQEAIGKMSIDDFSKSSATGSYHDSSGGRDLGAPLNEVNSELVRFGAGEARSYYDYARKAETAQKFVGS